MLDYIIHFSYAQSKIACVPFDYALLRRTLFGRRPQTDCGSQRNEALAFWLVLDNATMNVQTKRSEVEINPIFLYNNKGFNS